MRRYGEARKPDTSYRRRPGAYAILPRDGRLLLTHQAAPVPEIQLPGGGIDPGEAVGPALAREVIEETGWRIGRLRRLGVYRRFTYMPEYDLWAEKVCAIYIARPTRRLGPPTEEGHTALWLSPQAAIEALGSAGDQAMLIRWLAGEFGPVGL
jgi:8-oxo-dGTP diphosphatase